MVLPLALGTANALDADAIVVVWAGAGDYDWRSGWIGDTVIEVVRYEHSPVQRRR